MCSILNFYYLVAVSWPGMNALGERAFRELASSTSYMTESVTNNKKT